MASEKNLLKVSRVTKDGMQAAENQLIGRHRSNDATTKAIRSDLPRQSFSASAETKGILARRKWDERMLMGEAVFTGGYFLLMILWPPALGFFPLAITTIGLVWLVAEFISRLKRTALVQWYRRNVSQTVQWFKSLPPWVTLAYWGLIFLAWITLRLLTGKVSGYQDVSLYRAGSLVPVIGLVLLPISRSAAVTGEFLMMVFALGTYVEHAFGHWRFLLVTTGFFTVVQYLLLLNQFHSIAVLSMAFVLLGMTVAAIYRGFRCPPWLQVLCALVAYYWVWGVMNGFQKIAVDPSSRMALTFMAFSTVVAIKLLPGRPNGFLYRRIPWMTVCLCVLLVSVFCAQVGVNRGLGTDGIINETTFFKFGLPREINTLTDAFRSALISPFLHTSVPHLIDNVVNILAFGLGVERFMGRWQMLGIYLLGGMGAQMIRGMMILWSPLGVLSSIGVSAGASGAVFTLGGAGIFFTFAMRNVATGTKTVFYYSLVQGIVGMMTRISAVGFMSPDEEIADDVHLYGFIIGLILGVVFLVWHRFVPRHLLPD